MAQHSKFKLENLPEGATPGGRGGSKYNEPSRVLKYSRHSFLNKLGLGLIQGVLLVQYLSNVVQVREQKRRKPINIEIPGVR